MDDNGHIGPRVTPTWWDFGRQLVIFLLGVGVIVYAVVTTGYDVPFLITGMVLIGIVPVDRYVVTRANQVEENGEDRCQLAGSPRRPTHPSARVSGTTCTRVPGQVDRQLGVPSARPTPPSRSPSGDGEWP